MASRQQKRRNLITLTVLFNELKASGSDSLFVYYFVVERYMWQNGAEGVREWGWMLLLWKASVALAVVFVIYTFLSAHLRFHPAPPGECCCAVTEGGVSETPWQVGRHKDNTLLIIDGNKLHSLDVWQGNTWRMWIQMYLWLCECAEENQWGEGKIALSKRIKRGLLRRNRGEVEAFGGGVGRVMVVIPGKETLERCRGSL